MRSRGCGSNEKFFPENAWIFPSLYRIFVVLLRRKRIAFRKRRTGMGQPESLEKFFQKNLEKIWIEKEKGITFAPANGEGPG